MKIDEDRYLTINKAQRLLFHNYEINWKDAENLEGYIDEDTLLDIIDDLCDEVERLEEEKERQEEQIREWYKPISPYEFYGVSEDDFH